MARPDVPTGADQTGTDESAVVDVEGLDSLVAELSRRGYETKGPVVRDGAVVPGPVRGVADLPRGAHDEQGPGSYRLAQGDDERLFDWAVGPASWKSEFFPSSHVVWRAVAQGDSVRFADDPARSAPLAIVGARPCEVAALDVLDRVLKDGAHRDAHYGDRRDASFVVVAECASPSATCFCSSMATGPAAGVGFDLALTELDDADGHRFVVRAGSPRGSEVLSSVRHAPASSADVQARTLVLERARTAMVRRLETEGLADLLARNMDHPRWSEVAERCLSCANCTMVCPTCFCSDVRDTSDISGTLERRRSWSSCFDLEYSYLHGGPVRATTSSRYRQWMTHKLSTWWDQFDSTGCVGCGRCIAWCPVGIDITEEAAAIAASDGATRVGVPSTRSGT